MDSKSHLRLDPMGLVGTPVPDIPGEHTASDLVNGPIKIRGTKAKPGSSNEFLLHQGAIS